MPICILMKVDELYKRRGVGGGGWVMLVCFIPVSMNLHGR